MSDCVTVNDCMTVRVSVYITTCVRVILCVSMNEQMSQTEVGGREPSLLKLCSDQRVPGCLEEAVRGSTHLPVSTLP